MIKFKYIDTSGMLIKLIMAQKEYIEFLGERYNNAFIIAHLHHYMESNENIEKGLELRNKIQELMDLIS